MNKDNAKHYLPLMQALADGKEIQIRSKDGWRDVDEFWFSEAPDDYRIKPEPKIFWANVYVDRTDRYALGGLCKSEDIALGVRDEIGHSIYTYLRTIKIEL